MNLFKKTVRILMLVFVSIFVLQSSTIAAPSSFPIISRSTPAYASSDTAAYANDGNYSTTWRGSIPGWLAYDLSGISESQRSKIAVVWYNNDTYDYDYTIKNSGSYNLPKNYTIEGNIAAGGGSAPTSGWVTLATVTNNIYHSRQHSIDFSGYNWLRMNITEANSLSGSTASINLDVYNASAGIEDDWIFYGDSITAGGMVVNGSGSGTFSQLVNALNPNYFPIAENGGIGGIFSSNGAQNINTWLGLFPGKYVGISYGTNDAWGNQTGAAGYYKNLETMAKAVIAAGKIPVVAKIPWSRLNDIAQYAPSYNAQIDALYIAYPQIIKGPDFWTYFQNNPSYISSDNVHPTADGYNAMREQWAETMITAVYSSSSFTYGDIDGSNTVDALDYSLLKRYLIRNITSFEYEYGAKAADVNGDGNIDSLDFALIKMFLLGNINEFPV